MKIIRVAIPLLLLLILTLTSEAQDQNKYVITQEQLAIEFNASWTMDDIIEVRQELKKEDIDLLYTLLEFDDDGNLKKINASIDYNDGYKGSFKSTILPPDNGPGFRRDFLKSPRSKKSNRKTP